MARYGISRTDLSRYVALFVAMAAMGCAPEKPVIRAPAPVVPALEICPAPVGEKLSDDYDVTVNGQKVPVYACRVPAIPFNGIWLGQQRPLDQTELAGFAYWDMSAPADVVVVSRRPVQSVAVRPTSRGIQPTVNRNRISFRVSEPRPLTVEVNGVHLALHLFPSPSSEVPPPSAKDPDVRYFGPGIHRPGRMTLQTNQTLYIAGGAVVYGSVQATGASNIKILGRGILDAGMQERGRGQGGGCIRLNNCRNVTVEGVVLRDPETWCFTLQGCSKVSISNLKLVGLWKQNSDGIDVCNSEDVTLRDCFIRTFDDSIVVKGMRGRSGGEPKDLHRVTAERCVLWCDWGRALEIGAETSCAEMTDITFRDCDVIHTDFAAMDIQHGDKAAIRNVLYDNIRFEIDDVNYAPIMWHEANEIYHEDANWCPRLLVIEIVKTVWNRDSARGTVDNVTLRNVSVTGKPFPPSRIQGFDEEHQVKGVTIENLRINGRVIRSVEDANIIVKPFVQGLRVVAP
jgi:hypothetical protein